MKVLKNIKSELICAIDIETVRIEDRFEDLSEGFQSAWEYKNKQNGVIPNWEELSELWTKTSSLYAEFSKVCAVSLAYLDAKGTLVCKEFYGENEKELLISLGTVLDNMYKHNKAYRLAGHAAKFFDYPYLSKRYIINRLNIPQVLDSSGLKPWECLNLCSNELWKVGGTGAGSSLQALCACLDIPTSKSDLVGDEVGKAYFDKELVRIKDYCSLDTIATFNVIRVFKGESIFQFDEVNYVVGYSVDGAMATQGEEPKETQKPLLDSIFAKGQIDPEDYDRVMATAKTLDVEEKMKFCDLITAALLNKDKKTLDIDEQEIIDEILQP